MGFEEPTPFSSASEWAAAYKEHGLCVIPATVSPDGKKKHPIGKWQSFTVDGMDQQTFDGFYGAKGSNSRNLTMGFITGMASRPILDNDNYGLLVIDIDVKGEENGNSTWNAWLKKYVAFEPETWEAKTGSGGRHIYFAIHRDDMIGNTQSTIAGIDVRAQGGFVMAPPSPHYIQGQRYEWVRPPWEVEIEIIPFWLKNELREIMGVQPGLLEGGSSMRSTPAGLLEGGSSARSTPIDYGEPPPFDPPTNTGNRNAFGLLIDGRDKHMADVAYACVADLRRASPVRPPESEWTTIIEGAYQTYSMGVASRLPGDKDACLEIEKRGRTAMRDKIVRHLNKWDTSIAAAASVAKPSKTTFNFGGQEYQTFDAAAQTLENTEEASAPFKASELSGKAPERKWLWDQWIPANAVTSLYGDGGVGKSLLAQQLLYAVASGGEFMGTRMPKMKALAAFCEDDRDELHRRHENIVRANGGFSSIFDDVYLWPRVGFDNILVTFDPKLGPRKSAFFANLCNVIEAIRPGLVILDTAADMFGGNEIIRFEANYFVKSVAGQLIKLANMRGEDMSVIILAHPSQAGRMSGTGESGSTGWNNAVRSRLYLRRPEAEEGMSSDMRILTRMKSNYSASGDEESLNLMWSEGVLQLTGGTAAHFTDDDRRRFDSIRQELVRSVADAWSRGEPYVSKPKHPRELNVSMIRQLGAIGYKREQIAETIIQASRDGDIEIARTKEKRGWRKAGQT